MVAFKHPIISDLFEKALRWSGIMDESQWFGPSNTIEKINPRYEHCNSGECIKSEGCGLSRLGLQRSIYTPVIQLKFLRERVLATYELG